MRPAEFPDGKHMDDSVIIIGAGLAGLSAAVHAQIQGCAAHVFERQDGPGGVAAMWRRGDYLIDGGIHFAMAMEPGTPTHDLLKLLGVVPAVRFIDTSIYGRYVDAGSGAAITVTSDLDRLTSDLKSLFPADGDLIDELITGARALGRSGDISFGMEKPPELTGLLDRVEMMWELRGNVRYYGGKFRRSMAEYAEGATDPLLRHVLCGLFLPESPVWFVMMLLGLLATGGMSLLEGGSGAFASAIAQRVLDLGGQITYNTHVEEILVEGDRAVGVRLADGSEHRASAVIAAGDSWNTIYTLLGGRYTDDKITERHRDWPLTHPTVSASFGVVREFANDPWMTFLRLDRPIVIGDREIDGLAIRIFNYSPAFAPQGKTVVQVAFDADWDHWRALHDDRSAYDAEKERVAREILDRLETIYPGIATQVEMTDVATPYTTWRYTLNRDGAYMGWLMSADLIMSEIHRTLPGLKNLYLAGQWVMTGGVVPAIYSGRHAVQLLCHDRRKSFLV